MSNELVVIEQANALAVLSSKDSVESLINDVRQRVMSMEGGSLDTGVGRAKIKSNAFKATKAKTEIDKKYIQPLIDQVTAKIQPDLDTIQSLKDNKKVLNSGLDQIRKDVNAEVTAIEDKIKQKEAEEVAKIEAAKLAEELERDHEMGLLMHAQFLQMEEDDRLAAEQAEKLRLEQEEKARLEREALIAKEAKEAAEREAKEREERLEREKREAIEREENAKREAIAAEERAKVQAEEAEKRRIQQEKDAEAKRLADIEAAKQAETQRQKDEQARIEADRAEREANKTHKRTVNNAAAHAIADGANISLEAAQTIVRLIHKQEIPYVSINY